MKIERICEFCKKPFYVAMWNRKRKYCNRRCYTEVQKTLVGELSFNFGKRRTEEERKRMSVRGFASARYREKNNQWKGGKAIEHRGYLLVRISTLPVNEQEWFSDRRHGYIPEHRLIVARRLGRALRSDEYVHHINGIKNDNRDENLEIVDASLHSHDHANAWRTIYRLEAENRELKRRLSVITNVSSNIKIPVAGYVQ